MLHAKQGNKSLLFLLAVLALLSGLALAVPHCANGQRSVLLDDVALQHMLNQIQLF